MSVKKYISLLILIMSLISLVESSISYSKELKCDIVDSEKYISNKEEQNYIIHNINEELPEKNRVDSLIEEIYFDDLEEPIEDDIVEIIEFNIGQLQLREGIASDEVLRIREFLRIKGYTNISGGYYFNSDLKEVVKEYQKINDLNPDGIIGPKTFNVINEDMNRNSIIIPHIQIQLPDIVPDCEWILINKDSNTLYHYDNKDLINKYPVATGKSPEYTPEGNFYIVKKYINPYWGGAGKFKPIKGGAPNNPLGKRWLGLSIRGGGTYGIHGNSNVYSIGKYASLGCIRMFNDDIELIFDIIDYNTPVWIVRDISLVGQ